MDPYTTVVFDLDGTLLDTLADLEASVNHALAQAHLPARTTDEVRLFTGNGIRRLIERSVNEDREHPADASTVEAVLEEFKRHYAAHCQDHTAPYPGVIELVDHLKHAGVRVAVVSNKADFAVQELVERQFPGTFDCVLGEREEAGIRKKPAPDMVNVALERMGGERAGLVYVGDSEVDVQTAQNVGCSCLSCSWGFRERDWLVRAGATTIVDTPTELERVLLAGAV